MSFLTIFKKLRKECRLVRTSMAWAIIKHLYYRLHNKSILCSSKVTIYGIKNITTSGLLRIGLSYVGFMNCHDRTFLNIRGRLIIRDNFSIGKGCRFDIGDEATATFGSGYINPNTTFIIMHGISVGDGCSISWGCQFLDEDFHSLSYQGKVYNESNIIEIGSHVWIGSNVSILKGSRIPDGCVVASGSVITSKFNTKNVLIAGNPARVIRESISWE